MSQNELSWSAVVSEISEPELFLTREGMSLGDLEMISVSGGYCILDERMLVVGFGETKQDASLSLFCNIVDYKDKHGLDIEEISVFILDRSDPEGEQND